MVLATGLVLMLSSCGSDSSPSSSSNGGGTPNGASYTKANYGIPWNTVVAYGTITDSRDSQVYRTVKIGTQTWMAENLDYAGEGSLGVCPGWLGQTNVGTADSCSKYGRMYTWVEVMQGTVSSGTSPSGVKGICPSGWHVPSDAEWTALENSVDTSGSKNGTRLKSATGWDGYDHGTTNGTDTNGFRAIPAGYRGADGIFNSAGTDGLWWSATEYNASRAWYRTMGDIHPGVLRDHGTKFFGLSLRCAQD